MAAIDEIMQILYKCHAEDEFEDKSKDSSDSQRSRKSRRRIEKKNLEEIKSNVEKLLSDTCCFYTGSVEYSSLNKTLAVCNLEVCFEYQNFLNFIYSYTYKIAVFFFLAW